MLQGSGSVPTSLLAAEATKGALLQGASDVSSGSSGGGGAGMGFVMAGFACGAATVTAWVSVAQMQYTLGCATSSPNPLKWYYPSGTQLSEPPRCSAGRISRQLAVQHSVVSTAVIAVGCVAEGAALQLYPA